MPDFREAYRYGPLGTVPQVDRTIIAGSIHLINVSPPAGGIVEPPVPEYALHLLLRTAPLLRVGFNRTPRWVAVSPGSMLVAPPDTSCEYVADAAAHVLTVTIPKTHADEFAEESWARLDAPDEQVFRDPQLAHQLVTLWHQLDDDAPEGRLFADQVTHSVLEAIAGWSGCPTRYDGRERLANHTLRLIRDYVESRLADDLTVLAMADVADLSPAHFARAFAATVGMTPFRYVISRRLARARELLEHTERSTLDIALDVGFKTPSHFTARFRREFGVTPRALRPQKRRSDANVALI